MSRLYCDKNISSCREYRYVGSPEYLENLPDDAGRVWVQGSDDVIRWMTGTNQPRDDDGGVVATFIVDIEGRLWINDQRSEHVRCAMGENVLSAGEMTFMLDGSTVVVCAVSNQSTGYCPEPESWPAVAQALDHAGIQHPSDFTLRCIFRLCEHCGSKNIVKDRWFFCGVCDGPLSHTWNFPPG